NPVDLPGGDRRGAGLDPTEEIVCHRHRLGPLAAAVVMVCEHSREPAEQGIGADPLGRTEALEPRAVGELEVARDLVCDREGVDDAGDSAGAAPSRELDGALEVGDPVALARVDAMEADDAQRLARPFDPAQLL